MGQWSESEILGDVLPVVDKERFDGIRHRYSYRRSVYEGFFLDHGK